MPVDARIPRMSSWILVAVFFASLQILSVDVSGNGISANYLYIFIPLIVQLPCFYRRIVLRRRLLLVLYIYTLIYALGLPADFFGPMSGIDAALRRLFSFFVFLFPLLLSIVEFRTSDIGLFKKAVVLASLSASLKSVLSVALLAGSVGVYDMKPLIGSQRYGFILTLGFFIALLSDTLLLKRRIYAQRLVICSIILAGMVLTFSRATLVSVGAGLLFLAARDLYKKYLR